MNVYSILADMLAALAGDTELTNLSVAYYGDAQFVFIDHDPSNPPGSDTAPILQLHSPAKKADERNREKIYEFVLSIDIQDPGTEVRPEANANEYSATSRLNEFVMRSIAVIRAAKPSDWTMGYEYVSDTVSTFPVFTADVLITLTQQLVLSSGQDPLA